MKKDLKNFLFVGTLILIALAAIACAPSGAPGAPTSGAPQAAATTDPNAATVSGKINFTGTAPQPKKIAMDSEPGCAKQYTEGPFTENVVVKGGTLQNVFVYVKEGLGGKTFPVPQQAALLDQVGCRYVAHVFGIQAGQNLTIRNSDDNLHNIHPKPKVNKEFNIGQPRKGMETTKTFDKPEIMIPLACEVHSWMNGYVGVLDNPFYAVSGADGTFTIKGLPPGDYV
ncbi:MAG: hypothetical protein HY257_09580, partial [Chloroflexi bacterium]|nr:hypothetical protein [Chloroflexota bacterium]